MSSYTVTGRVLKQSGGLFTVRLDSTGHPLSGCRIECRARGALRREGGIFPGDLAEVVFLDKAVGRSRRGGIGCPSA